MTYKQLISQLAKRSGQTCKTVATVLHHLPDVLLTIKEGDQVRTRLGVFLPVPHKSRLVSTPWGEGFAESPASLIVKLRPGTRMRRIIPDFDEEPQENKLGSSK